MRPLALVISPKIEEKLRTKHDIEPAEVAECFYNRTKGTLINTREEHKTKPPPSEWFIAKTDKGQIFIKSCFDADKTSIRIYNKLAE